MDMRTTDRIAGQDRVPCPGDRHESGGPHCLCGYTSDAKATHHSTVPRELIQRTQRTMTHHPMCNNQHDHERCAHALSTDLADSILYFLDELAATRPGHSCSILEGWGDHIGYIGEAETLARRIREEARR